MKFTVRVLIVMLTAISCAKRERSSRMYIQLPNQDLSMSTKVSVLENSNFWFLTAPEVINDVSCYAVMLKASDGGEVNQKFVCKNAI